MGLLQWFQQRRPPERDSRLTAWHSSWAAALDALTPVAVTDLADELDAFRLPAEETEIEREMLAGLEDVLALLHSVEVKGLPVVLTGHRVVGDERCHFSAPASMPDEASQPSGTLLLTSGAALFAGTGIARRLAWHRVGEVVHVDRDLVLVRRDGEPHYTFRCNGFADVLCGAFIARQLKGAAASRPAGL
jgi:hypothetical protein